jgi:hypothetical protein
VTPCCAFVSGPVAWRPAGNFFTRFESTVRVQSNSSQADDLQVAGEMTTMKHRLGSFWALLGDDLRRSDLRHIPIRPSGDTLTP